MITLMEFTCQHCHEKFKSSPYGNAVCGSCGGVHILCDACQAVHEIRVADGTRYLRSLES